LTGFGIRPRGVPEAHPDPHGRRVRIGNYRVFLCKKFRHIAECTPGALSCSAVSGDGLAIEGLGDPPRKIRIKR
jgi:hypothetical protein